jgi:hypothetical protein
MGEFVLVVILMSGTQPSAADHIYFHTIEACANVRQSMHDNPNLKPRILFVDCFDTKRGR